ncbi:MAG TPA: hypothetical protein VK928_12740 [Longimicrobiales bacterium]|nr:hypothetical protein [Longimicrobiales bacterium]
MREPDVVPFSFDLHSLVQRSVASLYSHLVTRPTGRALRLGIESQIGDLGSVCLSVLDFTQVVVLDYSCADEAVAKLIQRYQPEDRPADAYFLARGLGEQHLEPIDEVLLRHGLAMVAEVDGEFTLLGAVGDAQREVWRAVQHVRVGTAGDVARHAPADALAVAADLESLVHCRVVLRDRAGVYYSLTALMPDRSAPS